MGKVGIQMNNTLQFTFLLVVCCTLMACTTMEQKELKELEGQETNKYQRWCR